MGSLLCYDATRREDRAHQLSILHKYKPIEKIAEGASGIVFRAQSLSSGEFVALKILRIEPSHDPELFARFQREALVTNQLTHPSAVKIFEYGLEPKPWLAMELLDGLSLEERIERGPLSEVETLSILHPVCDLLEEAHNKGILHRDLKAHHILLSARGPRVIDFGLASLQDAKTLTDSDVMAGSPEYMAPEQWDGLYKAEARSDIYSLGMIAYQCLAGRLPFEAHTLLDWMKKHFHEEPRSLSSLGVRVSQNTEKAILRAIAKRPSDRQQSMRELKKEFS